ncbi:hypothetical protein N0V82_008288 [Gnomoniopsis sp. IMI 355080]|nr:hypothetical protein N0V82_008288 [Gnomoniopsis sp. IMI 355080]
MSSSTSAGPAPTPLPGWATQEQAHAPPQQHHDETAPSFKRPKLRLHLQDLGHPGATRFLHAVDAPAVFAKSVQTVQRILYQEPCASIPATRSVTLYLEDMDGVAYTKGSDLDNDHKEIHFSLKYINGIKRAPEGAIGDATGAYEIQGVLVHELVHCYQHNGRGTCPGGLIEGIADFVRLKARLGAPHWKRNDIPQKWDQGYEKTAYFLDWLENTYGEGTVRGINEKLRSEKYVESEFWHSLFKNDVHKLWHNYVDTLKGEA